MRPTQAKPFDSPARALPSLVCPPGPQPHAPVDETRRFLVGTKPALARRPGGHMPGWYIHLDVARKTLGDLAKNAGARDLFAAHGPNADELSAIARAHPAYAALGAIG